MRAKLVIGAGYGDEGKGLTTDFLCHEAVQAGSKPIVVRANGGTQAAHTVVTPTGQRHVFHNHGSGSFLGVPTYLGPEFLVNPIGFHTEREELPAQARTTVYRHPQAWFTLPVDMMLNQLQEQLRGGSKHGSCGWGIGECVERSSNLRLPVIAADIAQRQLGVEQIWGISQQLVAHRLGQDLTAAGVSQEWQQRLADRSIIERWLEDCNYFLRNTTPLQPTDLPQVADTLVFEGAQGLGLDQRAPHFPHVTRSNTGSTNPIKLMRMVSLGKPLFTNVEVVYVTRAYATRHGAGPLEHEGEAHGCLVQDPTNIPNIWQDNLRSAPLDAGLLANRITPDMRQVLAQYPTAAIALMVTCLDQATEQYTAYWPEGVKVNCKPAMLAGSVMGTVCSRLHKQVGVTPPVTFLRSHGPTRSTVKRGKTLAMVALAETAN